jgi:hypothetical protein
MICVKFDSFGFTGEQKRHSFTTGKDLVQTCKIDLYSRLIGTGDKF